MQEAIINILIFNNNDQEIELLKEYLIQPSNNIFIAKTETEAKLILDTKHIGIVLLSTDISDINHLKFIDEISNINQNKDCFTIITGTVTDSALHLVQGLNKGAVDFITLPFMKNIVIAKINVFKRLYFKNKTILSLLENILPEAVLTEFRQNNKYTPKRHSNCAILFTDFIGFSKKARDYSPQELLKVLDYYFSNFDLIFQKYNIEKIKTIGDSYMAVGGLNANEDETELKMTLAALEIKAFVKEDIKKRKQAGKDFWEVRIGIHSGDLIAGVIGRKKFAFDVWGDSVNVASRCEALAPPNEINVSEHFIRKIKDFFNCTERGPIEVKNMGKINMFLINDIKPEFKLDQQGLFANLTLRAKAHLSKIDFNGIRSYIIDKLTKELPKNLVYHSLDHTLNVEQAVIKYANLEGVDEEKIILLKTAALFHDSGFLVKYEKNENIGVQYFKEVASTYGYAKADIEFVSRIIMATARLRQPIDIYENIISDADHDYLGRRDYHITAQKLIQEMAAYGYVLTEIEWLEKQIDYLAHTHQYYTTSAKNIRKKGKQKRINELTTLLKKKQV
ncbi:hypothetical protein DNU06_12675 [Putridiphycobacter roseus]|uniref:adenylate cyclase n=1 Tax=Putridiphycobacter roseus TaxID=2219161 RepID=A0A2W1MWB5_9FLAO|nr:adenylate/guanylate cyclase domain-containing protein [Putridiphycobacter roseus]PZE16399.1 hypothetical protein DNU06_12675 [Putridiphycobacter roseus]